MIAINKSKAGKSATEKATSKKSSGEKVALETTASLPVPTATNWTFFSNHSHVLICLAREPEWTLREVALRVGITERAVQRIVADLEEAEVLTRSRDGRRNRYEVHAGKPLRHPVEGHCTVQDLLSIVGTV